jgi:hypothetical protein
MRMTATAETPARTSSMSITVRPYRRGGWGGQDRERHLLQHGLPQRHKEVLTLEEFGKRFVEGHARANRHKPSGIAATETIVRVHLVPILGALRLDALGTNRSSGYGAIRLLDQPAPIYSVGDIVETGNIASEKLNRYNN